MKSIWSKWVFFLLAVIISLVDVFNSGNIFLQLSLALFSSIVVFYMPHFKYKLKKMPFVVILLANILIFALTYRNRVLLINMLIISYLIWSFITPWFLKYKSFLPLTFLITFTTVYAASLLEFSIPLFTFVFYPVYVLGSIVSQHIIHKTKKVWLFSLFNIIFSVLALSVFLFKALGRSILKSTLFLNIHTLGTITAVYLPFIAMFLIWFAAASNFLLYLLLSRSKKDAPVFELTSYFKPVYNFICFFTVAAVVTFIFEYSIRQNIRTTIRAILDPNITFNILVLCGVYLCLISLIGKGISNTIIAIFTGFLTLANYIKITYFDEPFYPWDMYLVRNLVGISKEYLNIVFILASSAVVILAVLLIIYYRKAVTRYLKPKMSVILLPFAVILLLINAYVLTHETISSQIRITKSWYIGKDEILANGVLAQNYFYLKNLNKYLHPKPEGYSEEAILAINKKYEKSSVQAATNASSKINPNVIVIMSESFWDVTKLNGIKFSKDIAQNVHSYQKGELCPPSIGGSTANTEFEALTGISMSFMSPGIIAYNTYLRTETPSLASVFKSNGYNTIAIHPNVGWFYNRNKVYKYIGFDKFLDVASFNMKTETKGPNISDDALVDKIIATLDASDKPSFIYAVSMQNHDPFDKKYKKFDVTIESDQLDASQKEILGGLAQGIYDADQSLGKLIDTLSKSKKPTLLYFFGDHAPRLGSLDNYYEVYDKLGAKEEKELKQGLGILKYYTTPIATWSNYQDMRSFPNIISPTHIGYEILKDAGVKYPNYFNIQASLETTFPILNLKNIDQFDANNTLIKDYSLIQYDLLFGKKYLKDIMD